MADIKQSQCFNKAKQNNHFNKDKRKAKNKSINNVAKHFSQAASKRIGKQTRFFKHNFMYCDLSSCIVY